MASKRTMVKVEVERFGKPGDPTQRWSIDEANAGWRIAGPDGSPIECADDLVSALRTSGSCAFVPGIALRIRTAGTVEPFALLPALDQWLDEPAGASPQAPWWEHAELLHLEDLSSEDFEAFNLDESRIILIDDDLCGVCSALVGNGPTAKQKRIFLLAEWEGMGDLMPKFLDLWATMHTDNGYGWGRHATGEISPGVRASVDNHEGMRNIFFDPLPHPESVYDEVLSWISGCISSTPQPGTDGGYNEFEVVLDGSDVEIICPDEGPHVEASGWIAPTVLAGRPSTSR